MAQGEVPSWIKDLTGENFLAVYDVGLDIRQELQLDDKPVIPLFQPAVKFSALLPMDGINMRDRYCDMRWKSTELLKKQGIITDFKLLQGPHRWQSNLKITCDSETVKSFMQIMDSEFSRRTSQENAKKVHTDIDTKTASEQNIDLVKKIMMRFHAVVIQLRQRYDNRTTLDVSDEYDVQDLLRALLYLHFDDVRPEEWTPSYAGKSSRVDFLLKQENIVIEVKKTRSGLGAKEIGDQLILDIARYSNHQDCKTLICMIYDPENRIQNPGGIESDLSGKNGKINVEVYVVPKQYWVFA